MASPPNYSGSSPPPPGSLALPRQRPTLVLPTSNPTRRKPSSASATSSTHPLRQTSFPPSERHGEGDSAAYSPDESVDFSDSEITSAISGVDGGTKKRKRGEKRKAGRPPKNPGLRAGSVSLVNGEDGRSTAGHSKRGGTAGASSVVAGEGGGASSDEDEDDEALAAGRGTGDSYDTERLVAMDLARKTFRNHLQPFQQERWDVYSRAKLRTADVRRLVNQTLSQSVPQNVVTVVQAYTKMFAGMLIEGAREVQSEWLAVQEERADGEENPVYKKLKRSADDDEVEVKIEDTQKSDGSKPVEADKAQTNGHAGSDDAQTDGQIDGDKDDDKDANPTSQADIEEEDEIAGVRRMVEECDRGPLLADHLRESLRRYRKSRYGGTVGFTGLSLEGRDTGAARMGGRRLFR